MALFIASYVLAASTMFPLHEALLRALLDLVMSALFIVLLLQMRSLAARFNQTFMAVCLTGVILNLAAWPLYAVLAASQAPQALETQPAGGEMLALMFWALFAWSLAVSAHIYRHALNVRFAVGFLLALLYFILAFSSAEAVFGAAT